MPAISQAFATQDWQVPLLAQPAARDKLKIMGVAQGRAVTLPEPYGGTPGHRANRPRRSSCAQNDGDSSDRRVPLRRWGATLGIESITLAVIALRVSGLTRPGLRRLIDIALPFAIGAVLVIRPLAIWFVAAGMVDDDDGLVLDLTCSPP